MNIELVLYIILSATIILIAYDNYIWKQRVRKIEEYIIKKKRTI